MLGWWRRMDSFGIRDDVMKEWVCMSFLDGIGV